MPELRGRPLKILQALYALSPSGPRLVTYEDIVVKAWELYPDDFGLRGYSDRFPDASDIHVPLYKELKSGGLVATGPTRQKKFKLTSTGWDLAASLFTNDGAPVASTATGRMSRSGAQELQHLKRATASQLYLDGQVDDILDTDFFAFYRTSVRAPAREFESRLAQTRRALLEAIATNSRSARELVAVDTFLRERFAEIIAQKTSKDPEYD
ncbi:MAG: hypothetical protein ACLP1E_00340 [Acidimicrobiales bacterium]